MYKPRILVIENSIHITGALKSVTRTAFDLKNDFEFVFAIPSQSFGRTWIESKGFHVVYELPFIEISKRISSLLFYIPMLIINGYRIAKIVKSERVDLIHVNDLYNLVAISSRIFGCKVPYITHIRFLPDKFPPILFNFWLNTHLRFAKRIIAVSHYLKNQLPLNEKISVIHNELPGEERYPGGVTKPDKPVILYLSNIIRGKGQEYAIQAFPKIYQTFPDWQLRFVGGDMGMKKNREYREELQSLANNYGIADRVQWVDFVEDVEREYRQAEIILNFSESESFSISCLEALFFGRPMIATRCGGPPEIIDHEETGILVDKGNVKQMEEAITLLISDAALRSRIGARASTTVRERFNIANTSNKLKRCYDLALGN